MKHGYLPESKKGRIIKPFLNIPREALTSYSLYKHRIVFYGAGSHVLYCALHYSKVSNSGLIHVGVPVLDLKAGPNLCSAAKIGSAPKKTMMP